MFFEKIINGQHVISHGGLMPGGDSHFGVYPKLGYTVVALTNYDLQIIGSKLEEMITRQ